MEPDLKKTTERALIDGLPQGLKDACDRLLARGMSKLGVATAVEALARKAAAGDPNKGQLIVAAVQAYLDTK